MSVSEDTPRRPTLTERHHELVMAMATKTPQPPSEGVELKQLGVGALAGVWVCDRLKVERQEDEGLGDAIARALALATLVKQHLAVLNASETNGGDTE